MTAVVSAPAPRLKVEKKGSASQVEFDHPHPETGSILLMAAVGTSSADFLQSLICQLVNAGSKGPAADEDVANFMLAVVTGIEPIRLALQIHPTHTVNQRDCF